MPSSQTITPTLLALGASKTAAPPSEPKVNNTFNQVFKNEVASKAKKTPVEPAKTPAPNKSAITPSNSAPSTGKNSATSSSSPPPPTDTTTNTATNTAPSNANNKEGQSGSVDQIDEDDIRPEDQKLPDLNDPVSLFNFVNKINELTQASTSIVPAESGDIAKTTDILSTSVDNLGVATLATPVPPLNTSELSPPKQGSEVSAATLTAKGSVDGSLLPTRFMSELSTAKDSKLTTLPIENENQLSSLPTPTVVIGNITDSDLKKQAELGQLPTQLEPTETVKVSLETSSKSAPPTTDDMQQNAINRMTQDLSPPPSSNTTTALNNVDATQSRVLASQLKTNNANDTKDTRANSLADQSRTAPILNELKKSIGELPATVAKVDLSSVAPSQLKTLLKNVETPLTTSAQIQALPVALAVDIPTPAPATSGLADDMPAVSLVTPAAAETNIRQVSHGVEKPEHPISVIDSSELFTSALNTEFARAQQEQNVAQESLAIEEFAVNTMTSETTTPAPIVQAPPVALSSLPMTEHIAARFGTRAWDQAIGQKIVWMVAGGEQTAQLTLNPPDLGPVQVVLSISDSFVDASFVSSHLDVREAIEAAAPKLREMMDNAGISLSGFSVSAESAQSGNPFNSEKSQQNSQSQARNTTKTDEGIDSTKLNTPAQRSQPELGLVDTFA